MLFNSFSFLLAFLPFFLILFYLIKHSTPWLVIYLLAVASILFYWNGGSQNPIIILASISTNYIVAIAIAKCTREKITSRLLFLGIIFNLGFLTYFKYYNFYLQKFQCFLGQASPAFQSFYLLLFHSLPFNKLHFWLILNRNRLLSQNSQFISPMSAFSPN